jgi:hypothetical protein
MSSRPEAGEDDARSNDLDMEHDHEAGEELPGASNDPLPEFGSISNGIGHEDAIPVLAEEDTSQQNSEFGSVDSLKAMQTQNADNQLLQRSASADETSSVPDDTPSIQVPYAPLTARAHSHIVRVPFSPHSPAMYIRFAPKGHPLALTLLADPSTDASSPACRFPL